MADRPEIEGVPNHYPWATLQTTRVTRLKNGRLVVLDNKRAPLPEHTQEGLKYREPPNFQETNWMFDGAHKWIQHLDERYSVGDVIQTTRVVTSAETVAELSARLGGEWESLGTEDIGPITIEHFRKIA